MYIDFFSSEKTLDFCCAKIYWWTRTHKRSRSFIYQVWFHYRKRI